MIPPRAMGTALITGASSGIGCQMAHVFAQHGHDLFLTARDEGQLKRLAEELRSHLGVRVDYLAIDLSTEGAADELFAQTRKRGIDVDILINSAGFAMRGEFSLSDAETMRQMLLVNVVALTQLTRLFLPAMVERGSGRVMNVASISAYMPGPLMAGYFASKAYVLSFSEALANELAGTGVTVTALCPGPTLTQFPIRAGLLNTKAFRRKPMDAAAVAREGYRALMKGKRVLISGWKNRLELLPTALLPRRVLAFFARQYNEDATTSAVKMTTTPPDRTATRGTLHVHSGS